ncbi:Uncharacterised protein [Achromobacter xylosoxidans]|uniref:DUF4153 domain-containing protein n=1 Tax=Alcaligenes xylosoxydans xylosoxydans TaxID=85698 RepID=UPI0006C637AC|nr:DUF4153 domain-containing protein [Achromobacter xylosoxidans]CUI27475.1 Uncharacterised protein [Achromobacter xylosoxidans]
MATRSPLSAPERTILVHGALGALLALALHAALLNRVWPWHNPFATLFAIQWVWLVPLAGAMLAGMRSGRRWLLALLAYALALPALHAYGLMPLLGSQPVRYSDDGPRALATVITAASGFMLLPLIQALDPSRPGWDYPAVFRAAWRNTVKLALAGGLALAVWLLFWAAGAMFGMIGIGAVGNVVKSTRFTLGVMPLVLAVSLVGVHRRPQLADTLQRSWLTLTAWLLPLVALVGIAFVLALAARLALDLQAVALSAGALIAFSALWIKLINSAWQDSPEAPPFGPRLRAVLRVATCGLLPLALVALYGLVVRVEQYGWTIPRIWGVYAAILLTLYALGYAWAALAPRRFHTILGGTNIVAAFCALAMLALVNTPLLNPDRIEVDSQVQRLIDGRVPPEEFSYLSAARDRGEYGRQAVRRLADGAAQAQSPKIAIAAADALTGKYYDWGPRQSGLAASLTKPDSLQVHPAGGVVPDAWWRYAATENPFELDRCVSAEKAAADDPSNPVLAAARCWLIHADITGPGAADLVLYVPPRADATAGGYETFLTYQGLGKDGWRVVSSRTHRTSESGPEVDMGGALAQGQVHTEPRQDRDLIVGGRRLPLR